MQWEISKIIEKYHQKCHTDWEECAFCEETELNKLQSMVKNISEPFIEINFGEDKDLEFINCFRDICFNIICSQQEGIFTDENETISNAIIEYICYSVYTVMTCGNLTKSNIDWEKV